MKDATIRFKDQEIYYVLYPQKQKSTLVCLHPFGSSHNVFDPIIMGLKKDFQVLLIDLPGHGKSGISKHVGFKDMPEVIKALLDQYEIVKASFLGVQVGSIIAQGFADIYPDYMDALVSVGSYSIYNNTFKKINSELWLQNIFLPIQKTFLFETFKRDLIENASVSGSGKKHFKATMDSFTRRSDLAFRGIKRFYEHDKKQMDYPTYVVCGDLDHEVIKDASLSFEQLIPKTVLEGYKDCKSIVFLDQPRLFLDHMLTFLKTQKK